MDDETILKPCRANWSGVLFLSLMFVSMGALMANHPRKESDFWIACLGIVFFGFIAIVSIMQLFAGYFFLKIGAQGIQCRLLWRTYDINWTDVEEIGVYKELRFAYRVPIPYWTSKVGLRMSSTYLQRNQTGLYGVARYDGLWNIILPESYGMEPAELAKLLKDKKKQYTGKS